MPAPKKIPQPPQKRGKSAMSDNNTPQQGPEGSSRKVKRESSSSSEGEARAARSRQEDELARPSPLSLTAQPSRGSPDYGLPWSREWPEIIEYYMRHPDALDFTGTNLYKSTGRRDIPQHEYVRVFRTSPATLTTLLLFSETARPNRNATPAQLLWLKGEAIKLVNEALVDVNRQLSPDTLSDVIRLANYEHVFGRLSVMRTHRAGVKQIVSAMGGIQNLKGQAKLLVPLILWADRARQATKAYEPNEPPPEYPEDFEPGLQPLHPLNIALIPRDRLTTRASRKHALGVSILSPCTGLMVVLNTLQTLCSSAAMTPADESIYANALRNRLTQIENSLLGMRPDDSAFFTDEKYALNKLMFDSSRLCSLIVVNRIAALFDRTKLSDSKLDHAVMSAGMLDIKALLHDYTPVLIWILFLLGPFVEGVLREHYIDLTRASCEKLCINSWKGVKDLLKLFYYFPEIQDAPGEEFWDEVEPVVAQPKTYDKTSVMKLLGMPLVASDVEDTEVIT